MIVRNVAVRHGRTALAAPVTRACQRAISTDPTPPNSSSTPISNVPTHVSTPATAPPPTGTSPAAPPTVMPRVLDPRLAARLGIVKKVKEDTTVRDFIEHMRLRKRVQKLGSGLERVYSPGLVLRDPPKPKDVTLELLMASQCHMGHHTSQWNPSNSRYIYGVRQGIHVISLEQTAAHLRRAARLVEEVAYYGGLILFVGTRKGHMEAVVRAAQLSKACHLFSKWTPGTITNRDQLLGSAQLKIVDERDQTLPGFEKHIRDRRPITPDLVVCLNPLENYVLLHECVVANIPTIGVIDTNADPTKVTYPIPANDDSLRSITLIAGVLGRAGEIGQSRRMADAKRGVTTWQNPADVVKFLQAQAATQAAQIQGEFGREVAKESELLDNAILSDLGD